MCLRFSRLAGHGKWDSAAESFHCSLIAEPALKEQAFGQFEGMTTIELLQNNPDAAEALFNLDAEYCPPEGESLSHASQRIMHFLTNLEKNVIIEQYVLCLTDRSFRVCLRC